MVKIVLSILVLIVIIYGLIKKRDIFNDFVEGSKESFSIIISLFPRLLGMIFCVNIFIESGILNNLFSYIKLSFIPQEIIPLMILRPLSSSSSLAILSSLITKYGPDSYIGIQSSIMQGSTDTTIYILTLYFGSIGIKKNRYALLNGLLADVGTYFFAIIIVWLFFK